MTTPKIFRFFATVALSVCMAVPVYAANIAVVGPRSELNTISTEFTNSFGDTVTRYNTGWASLTNAQLDQIFSSDIVWEGNIFASIPGAVQTRMQNYVNSNGGLFLTGERSCCEAHNAGIQAVARALTGDNGILIGGLPDLFGHAFSNSPTTILTDPNDIRGQTALHNGPGRVQPTGGINSDACFTVSEGTTCTAAAWGPDVLAGNMGRLVVYGDINSQPSLVSQFNGDQFENIRSFLLAGFSGGGDVCDDNPNLPGCDDPGDPPDDPSVPVPGTLGLLGLGLIGVAYSRRRKI